MHQCEPAIAASDSEPCACATVFETKHAIHTTMAYHRHDIAFATVILEGSYAEVSDGVPHAYGAGSIVLHHPEEEHADHFSADSRCLNVELPASLIQTTRSSAASLPIEVDATLAPWVRKLQTVYYAPGDASRACIHAFRAMLAAKIVAQAPLGSAPDWIDDIVQRFPWVENVPLGTAAMMAGVHPTTFSRTFRKHVGVTPNEYRRRARMGAASELLLTSGRSLATIALMCGFSDQSHLTRCFSEGIGMSPRRYTREFAR